MTTTRQEHCRSILLSALSCKLFMDKNVSHTQYVSVIKINSITIQKLGKIIIIVKFNNTHLTFLGSFY